jgi:hypothetical protein
MVDRTEPREVAVEGDDLTPMLYGHRCDDGVCDQVAGSVGLVAQAA